MHIKQLALPHTPISLFPSNLLTHRLSNGKLLFDETTYNWGYAKLWGVTFMHRPSIQLHKITLFIDYEERW